MASICKRNIFSKSRQLHKNRWLISSSFQIKVANPHLLQCFIRPLQWDPGKLFTNLQLEETFMQWWDKLQISQVTPQLMVSNLRQLHEDFIGRWSTINWRDERWALLQWTCYLWFRQVRPGAVLFLDTHLNPFPSNPQFRSEDLSKGIETR